MGAMAQDMARLLKNRILNIYLFSKYLHKQKIKHCYILKLSEVLLLIKRLSFAVLKMKKTFERHLDSRFQESCVI